MENIRYFETNDAYETAKSNLILPNVALVEGVGIKYKKIPFSATVDINPVVAGQYATITPSFTMTYLYVKISGDYEKNFYCLSVGEVKFGTNSSVRWNKGNSVIPSNGIYVSSDQFYGETINILGVAMSDTEYTSWDAIPTIEKVEFSV